MALISRDYRRVFMTSALISAALLWLYTGLAPVGTSGGIFPPAQGTLLNEVMRIIALPLAVLIIAGGGVAALSALKAQEEGNDLMFAITAPPGILWVFFLVRLAMGMPAG